MSVNRVWSCVSFAYYTKITSRIQTKCPTFTQEAPDCNIIFFRLLTELVKAVKSI